MTLADSAVELTENGFAVFPLAPNGKQPYSKLAPHGCKDAVLDPDQTRERWRIAPSANIGLATSSRLFVLDIDLHGESNGYDSLDAWLEETGIELPETVSAVTASGGIHYWFTAPEGVEVRNGTAILAGVDVRGKGGYVVAPPSVLDGDEYEWECDPWVYEVAPAPRELLELIVRERAIEESAPYEAPAKVLQGERNNEITRLAFSLWAKNLGRSAVRAAVKAENSEKCDPPLSDREIESILRSVFRKKPGVSKAVAEKRLEIAQSTTLATVESDDDEAQEVVVFNSKTSHTAYAKVLMKNGCGKINGTPAAFHEKRWRMGWNEIDAAVLDLNDEVPEKKRQEIRKYLSIRMDELKVAPPNLIAFNNGILDIDSADDPREMTLLDPSDELVMPNSVPWDWNPNARSELLDRTLMKIACDDGEMLMFLYEIAGLSMYRSNRIGEVPILLGRGANGKSTFLKLVEAMAGTDNTSHIAVHNFTHNFAKVGMVGKTLNIDDDIPSDKLSSAVLSVFKKVATGDTVYTDVKNKDGFSFVPYCINVITANEMPHLCDTTNGMFRRLVFAWFNATFKKTDPDYDIHIMDKLIAEEPMQRLITCGIIGLKNALSHNSLMKTKDSIRLADEAKTESSSVLQWESEKGIEVKYLLEFTTKMLYEDYSIWCGKSGYRPMQQGTFTGALRRYHSLDITGHTTRGGMDGRFLVLPKQSGS